ncbi:MAG: AraC family transcriptional regulator [Ruminococcus sp.]|uniref:helix-turn-helix domain-containing protein n=1 Tax=Ruminococcus sp. TaxID=41978 RepID=UPI0025E562EB|nr:AraC family transcriptional regulator [Ruminococcus sp.]MCR5601504.1 AraC family transcriptional regulator [Ruminococcus sp.]
MNIRCIGCNSIYDRDYRLHCEAVGEYMLILTKSRCCISVNGAVMKLSPDTVFLWSGKVVMELFADDTPIVCDWICFEADAEKEFLELADIEPDRPVCFADTAFISELMRNIAAEYYSLGSRRTKMLDSYMRILLVKISETGLRETMSSQAAEPHYGLLLELREKIYRNPQMKWNVDTMAAYVNMSRSYFQHLYRETFDVSCIADVISGKIEKAKEILSETGCTVSQVAAMCGYDNEEHFMRQFKKIVGVTPTKYRKQG